MQVLVVLLVNELRIECPFIAPVRIEPVLGTILTSGLRALVLAAHHVDVHLEDAVRCLFAISVGKQSQ